MTSQLAQLGNPSSLHGSGRSARRSVEEARETIGRVLGARPGEVVFTSGGTEADNLAVKGLFWAGNRDPERPRRASSTSAVEHHAVLDSVHWLAAHEGAVVELLPVDRLGRVDVDAARASIAGDPDSVALVSVMWANNEVGTVQPISALAGAGARPRHPDAHRRGAGGRVAAGRLRHLRGRRRQPYRAQARGARSASGRFSPAASSSSCLCCTAAARNATSARAPSTRRRSRGSPPRSELAVKRQPEQAATLSALRDALVAAVTGSRPGRRAQWRPGRRRRPPAPRQRPLVLPGLRGRLAADAPRRQGHRVLDGLGLLRRRARRRATCCWPWAG